MSIPVSCPQCSASFRVRDEMGGKRGKCPRCQAVIEVPVALELASTASETGDRLPATDPSLAASQHAATVNRTSATPAAMLATAPATGMAAPSSARPRAGAELAPGSPELAAEVLAAFQGNIPKVRQSLMYQVGVLLVALVMVILPLIYVGLIGLAAYLVYYHMVNHVGILGTVRGRGAIFTFLVYAAPLVIGGILVVFMIKPLFARPSHDRRRRSLTREAEPLLFAFVDRLCEAVGASRPRRIDVDCQVNASASFRRGWLSMFGNDLVLTIGMPLVAGLTARQFAGVLAHEFGHFSQGVGMRLTYIIRSISYWFTRVVYERDEWDEWLARSTDDLDLRLAWVLYLAKLFVWLTRKVLWVLMMIGHAVGGFMLRQMEFDADRYEARLAGSDTFAATARQLMVLNVAYSGAQSDLGEFFREGRLSDNLPKLMMANVKQLPAEVQEKIDELIGESKTGLLDTHPCDRERIENARRENAPGIFHSQRPASDLFQHFDALATNVTWDFYRDIFGPQFKPTDMHSTDDLLSRQGREQQANQALDRFFQNSFQALRPVWLPGDRMAAPQDARQSLVQLKQARLNMQQARETYSRACADYDLADTEILQADQAAALLRANLRVRPSDFAISANNPAAATAARAAAVRRQQHVVARLEPFEYAAGERLFRALELLHVGQVADKVPDALQTRHECGQLLPALAALRNNFARLLELRNMHGALACLCGNLQGNESNPSLIHAIQENMERTVGLLNELRSSLAPVVYPFDHARGRISIAQYLLPEVIDPHDLGGLYDASEDVLNKLPSLYVRIAARLASVAEQVETALGLEPLPPKPLDA